MARLEKGYTGSMTEETEIVVVTHRRTATTSRFREVEKAVECLYYILLFLSPDYSARAGRWQRWAGLGFDLTVREPPRDARREDRLKIDIDPAAAPRIPMRLNRGNTVVKQELVELLHLLDVERDRSKDDDGTALGIVSSEAVQERLVRPLLQSLHADVADENETQRYLRLIDYCVGLLTEPNVLSLRAD